MNENGLTKTTIKLDEGAIRRALGDPDTAGMVLFIIALREFGPAVMGDPELNVEAMDPSEMWAELHSRYGTWVTEEGENKLNAVITGLSGGSFWEDIDIFVTVSTALFDGDLGDLFGYGLEELNATEIMWAVLEMSLLWEASDTPTFSDEVQLYIQNITSLEQEEQEENAAEVETAYLVMLDQLAGLGIPMPMLRDLDEEYADVMASFKPEDGLDDE